MPALLIMPKTFWVNTRGVHHGNIVEVKRVTPNAVYFRTVREGASSGPRARKSGTQRLSQNDFLINYRPNGTRDWAQAVPPQPTEEVPTPVPAKPAPTPKPKPAPLDPPGTSPPLLHPDEAEIVELMHSRTATFQDVQRTYHIHAKVLSAIMQRHGIGRQTAEERRAKALAHYHATKSLKRDQAQRAHLAATLEAATLPPPTPTPPTLEVAVPTVPSPPASPQRTWLVRLRTTITVPYPAANYLAAAQAAMADYPAAEIIGIEQEGN